MKLANYFDPTTQIERVPVESVPERIATATVREPSPIVIYANALRKLRGLSPKVGDELAQLEFGVLVRDTLADVGVELGLPASHFTVDTSGDPLLVTEGDGSHWIMPTNFEAGSYFSTPHADHQYGLTAAQLPKINIGKYVKFGKGAGVNAGGDVTIGDGAWLSPGSLLLRQDHTAYGRPSVGSRSVAMTRQPSIHLGDFAWVGRDAMVGWNCDYIGTGGIVGTRSFVNSWVGDHSIVGDHDRILQYQPFKAYLIDTYRPSVEETIRITDWSAVDRDWKAHYYRTFETKFTGGVDPDTAEWLTETLGKNYRALAVSPSTLDFLRLTDGSKIDVISAAENAHTPYILQWANDTRSRKVRVRTDFDGDTLPFETAESTHYNKKTGYNLVISDITSDTTQPIPLDELQRPLAKGGLLIASAHDLASKANGFQQSENLVEVKDIAFNGRSLKVFEKK